MPQQNGGMNKPYQCMLCPYKTLYKGNLDKHHRIHTGERPYKCRFCSKDFSCQSNHKAHEERHAGFYKFKCPYKGCAFGTNRKVAFETHVERQHSNEMKLPDSATNMFTDTKHTPQKRQRTQSSTFSPKVHSGVSYDTKNGIISGYEQYNAGLQILDRQSMRLPSAQTLLKKEPQTVESCLGQQISSSNNVSNNYLESQSNHYPILNEINHHNVRSSKNLALSLATSMLNTDPNEDVSRERTDSLVQDLLLQASIKDKTLAKQSESENSQLSSPGIIEPIGHQIEQSSDSISISVEPITVEPLYQEDTGNQNGHSNSNQPITDQYSINSHAAMGETDSPILVSDQPISNESNPMDSALSRFLDQPPDAVIDTSTPPSTNESYQVSPQLSSSSNVAKVRPNSTSISGQSSNPPADSTAATINNLVHQGRLYRCNYCNILFPEYSMFVMHAGTHGSSSNPFQCHYCQKEFAHKYEFMSHFVKCIHN